MNASHTQVSKKQGGAPHAGLLSAQAGCPPTPERMEKSIFAVDTATPGNPLRVLGTVQALLNARDITQDAANAAERWYRDWVFAYVGHIEYPTNHTPNTLTRHDDVSWQMTRAHAAGRLADVDRKSTRLGISYAVFCLKKKKNAMKLTPILQTLIIAWTPNATEHIVIIN